MGGSMVRILVLAGGLLLSGGAVWAETGAQNKAGDRPVLEKSSPTQSRGGYLRDPEYRKILQYDYLPYWLNREKNLVLEDEGDGGPALRKQDRALVLAGKGFQIPDLRRFEPEPSLEINPFVHIKLRARPRGPGEPVDRLDPEFDQAARHRVLIFRSRESAFYNVPVPQVRLEPPPEPPPARIPEPVPETRLLLSDGGQTRLLLLPARKRLDLLRGNEVQNLREFYQYP